VVVTGEYGKGGVFEWLKNNTPVTSCYDCPLTVPEYGILASWGLGSKLYYLAHRPSVATAFGWEAHGIYEISGFLTTGNPAIAYDIATRNRARYILIRDEDYNFEFGIAKDGVKKGKLPPGTVSVPDPDGSVYQRLKYFDGSAISSKVRFLPALGNYRLVHESSEQFDTPVMPVSHYKVFEVVPGAMATGVCLPGDPVTLTLSLRTSTGRTVPFSDRTEADAAGRFSFRVPYATGTRQGDTVPLGKYAVSCGRQSSYSFAVSEEMIVRGGTVSLAK
jgi:asparagine N-glycosylation enzyme membrane subunit Stt3